MDKKWNPLWYGVLSIIIPIVGVIFGILGIRSGIKNLKQTVVESQFERTICIVGIVLSVIGGIVFPLFTISYFFIQ